MTSTKNQWLCSPAVKKSLGDLLKLAQRETSYLENMYWVASSGTSDPETFKFVGLTRQGLENSAEAVNRFFGVTPKDCIYNALPLYHVGGFSTRIRAELAGCRWIDGSSKQSKDKWNPRRFVSALIKYNVTITSLVPTQVFDLVTMDLSPNAELRVLVVGGGRLNNDIYERALKLGWPLTRSYGMTEHASQIANEMNGEARWLSHIQSISDYKTRDGHKRIAIHSTSQCSYIYRIKLSGERSLEWAKTPYGVPIDDHITWDSARRTLSVSYRLGAQVKVLGVLVNLEQIENKFGTFLKDHYGKDSAIFMGSLMDPFFVIGNSAHERLENQIVLCVKDLKNFLRWKQWVSEFNETLSGPERIQRIEFVDALPRNEMGKTIRRF